MLIFRMMNEEGKQMGEAVLRATQNPTMSDKRLLIRYTHILDPWDSISTHQQYFTYGKATSKVGGGGMNLADFTHPAEGSAWGPRLKLISRVY